MNRRIQNSFIKDSVTMASSPLITQLLGLMIIPLITRIYSPEMFGLAATFMALSCIFAEFAGFGFSSAILLPDKDETANYIFIMVIIFTIIPFFVTSSIIILFSSQIAAQVNFAFPISYYWLIPILVLTHGVFQALRYLTIRNAGFSKLVYANVSAYIIENSFLIFVGIFVAAEPIVIIIAAVISAVTRILILIINVGYKKMYHLPHIFSIAKYKNLFKRYKKFPIFTLPTNIISRYVVQIPIIIFTALFSAKACGYYIFATRILNLPVNLIGNSVSEVYFQRSALLQMEGKKEISIRLFSILTEISFIPLIIVVLLGQEIFSLLLGSNWSEAGLYAQVLSISVFVRFIFAPSPYLLILLEKQQYQLYFNIILTIITILSLAIGYLFKEIIISLVLISFLSAALHVFMGCYMFKLIGIKFIEIIKPFIKVFPIVLLVILIICLSKIVFSFDNFILIIIACIIMISYMFYVVYTNKYLLGALKRAF